MNKLKKKLLYIIYCKILNFSF